MCIWGLPDPTVCTMIAPDSQQRGVCMYVCMACGCSVVCMVCDVCCVWCVGQQWACSSVGATILESAPRS